MPDYICSGCGNSFDATPDPQGNITCASCGQVMSAADAQKPLPGGTRIDGYVLIRHLGSGGSGSVYLAEQTAMERTVALKILNPDRVDKNSAERFLEEARNAAKFENPHVVAVIDSGHSEAGYYYIAMQYVDGETLETMLQHGRIFSEEETLEIGITVAESLQAIWNKYKMFHKDIKPANIMLTREKQPMILDMGTAQEHGESKLADGNIEGSPYYMSPEQARGEALTWSTDLYSLGTTMYQMVTGKYPYDAPEVEAILRMHDSAPFPEPSERAPDIPVSEKMTALLRRMMGKTPADRYDSWNEFIRDAKKLLEELWEKKDPAAADPLHRKYQERDPDFAKPKLKPRKVPSVINFVLAGIAIFILLAALLGSYFLYMTGDQNSLNARRLLAPIRKQVNELIEHPDPDAVEELIRKAEPYFERFGILPSLRAELEDCRKKTEDFRELMRKEELGINNLETQTAECIKSADEILEAIKKGGTTQIEVPCSMIGEAWNGFGEVDWGNRYIDVDLSEQYVRFYDDNAEIIWESDCITGAPDGIHNTVEGVWYVTGLESPSKLVGWENGKKIYETYVRWWMPFEGNGIGFHDADWQPAFGGYMYASGYGSHGCVNLPVYKAEELWYIIEVDDVVIVHW